MSNGILYVGLGMYFVFIVGVGIIGGRKVKSASDFALAGNKLGPIPLGLAFTASFFSAAVFQGYVGWTYSWGQSALWIFIAIYGGTTLGFILLAKGVRDGMTLNKAETMADWLANAYHSDVLRGIIVLAFLLQIFYIAGQYSAGATLLSTMISGFDYKVALILVALVTTCYVAVGGLFADVYTSIGQTVLMMFCSLFVFIAGLSMFSGGLTEVSARLAEQSENFIAVLNPDSTHMYSGLAVLGIILVEFTYAGQPQLLNKIMALKNPKDMKNMIITWMIASFCCLLVMFGGSFMHVINPNLAAPDTAVIEFVKLYPPIISSILTIGLISALMSTSCGLLLVISTCISHDIFKKILVKHGIIKMDEAKADKVSFILMRIMPFVISAVCVYCVLNPPTFMGNMVWIGISAVASSTLPALIVSIFIPRFKSKIAAICASIGGFGFYCFIHLITHIERSVMAGGAWGMCFGFVVMIGVGYFTGDKRRSVKKKV